MPPAIYRPEDGPRDNFPISETSDEYFDAFSELHETESPEPKHDKAKDRTIPVVSLQQDLPVSLLRSRNSQPLSVTTTERSTPDNSSTLDIVDQLDSGDTLDDESESDNLEIEEDGLEHYGKIMDAEAEVRVDRVLKSLQPAELIYPKSQYRYVFSEDKESFEVHTPQLPPSKECTAVRELLEELDRKASEDNESFDRESSVGSSRDQDFFQLELTDFTIYLPASNHHHPYEMRPLDHLANRMGSRMFLFDGILSAGQERRYVEGVPFEICSLGNYGEEHHCVGDQIWIQSIFNRDTDVYYHLKSPSAEYLRFYSGFLWMADLAKHFVDFCMSPHNARNLISIHDFRNKFSVWMNEKHGGSPEFQAWYQQHQGSDFRRAVNQNIRFLHKEAIGVDEDTQVHSIWAEIMERTAIRKHPIREEKTVVTPYVYECFSHMRFGKHLKSVVPDVDAEARRVSQGHSLQLTIDGDCGLQDAAKPLSSIVGENWIAKEQSEKTARADEEKLQRRKEKINSIKVGDVVSVVVDGSGSVWKDEVTIWKGADDCWYLLVQGVHTDADGQRSFDGLWLYKPSDTTCAKMKYPYASELFLSDHCTCPRGREEEENVIDVVNVIWHGMPSVSNRELFIRQTYLDGERFVTMKDSHKRCEHLKNKEKDPQKDSTEDHRPGETVLIASRKIPRRKCKNEVEPYEVVENIHEDTKRYVRVRRLLRRAELATQMTSAPNELVYTDTLDKVPASAILHRCLVRFYTEDDIRNKSIPAPYSRNGTGNAFYITTKLVEDEEPQRLEPIQEKHRRSLLQGFDPFEISTSRLLRGLDLYCGGGNFGRGLEEGGAVHHEWAVDLAETAIHTYHANLTDPKSCKLFFGSVDDLLLDAFRGNPQKSSLVPMPGDVEFVSAGSPCQGFSLLNPKKNNERGLKNQSLVASVAAYVDFYRPKYGLLENVLNMAQKGRGRDEDVLSQLICSIVGMGYQTQVFVLDAWSCGSPQSRSRLFLSFAAPGYEPIQHPELSHSHPPTVRSVAVGLKANGESFGSRKFGPTPFRYVSAGQATADLPRIGDARTYQCIPHPDHVVAKSAKEEDQQRIACIPVTPKGMTFAKAWKNGQGTMTRAERALFPETTKKGEVRANVMANSKAWGRVHPDSLFSTITVVVGPDDARMGTCLHWNQNRYLSVMEGRRAQSFPDDEILVGLPTDQWKIVGNSVARTVSLALGLKLREAWEKRPVDDMGRSTRTKTKCLSILPPAKTKQKQKSNGSLGYSLRKSQVSSALGDTLDDETAESEPLSRDELVASTSSASSIQSENAGSSSKRPPNDSDEPDLRPSKVAKLSGFTSTTVSTRDQEAPRYQPRVELPSSANSSSQRQDVRLEKQNSQSNAILPPPRQSLSTQVAKCKVAKTISNGLESGTSSLRAKVTPAVIVPSSRPTRTSLKVGTIPAVIIPSLSRPIAAAQPGPVARFERPNQVPTSSQVQVVHPKNASTLNQKLELVQKQKRMQAYSSSSEDSEDETEGTGLPVAARSQPAQHLVIRPPVVKKKQAPATSSSQLVISLLSSDEEESEDEPRSRFKKVTGKPATAPTRVPPPSAPPNPCSDIFNSLMQTKRQMMRQPQ